MARIIMADEPTNVLLEARPHLVAEGHDVAVYSSGRDVLAHLQQGDVDVIVLSFFTRHRDGLEILADYERLHPTGRAAILWLTDVDATGVATRHWLDKVHSYVLRPYSPWHIVLSVEQLVYRDISIPDCVIPELHLKYLVKVVGWYVRDVQTYPDMSSPDRFEADLRARYAVNPHYFLHPVSKLPYIPNANLSLQPREIIARRPNPIVLYEAIGAAGGNRHVAFATVDGTEMRGLVRSVSDAEWSNLVRTHGLTEL